MTPNKAMERETSLEIGGMNGTSLTPEHLNLNNILEKGGPILGNWTFVEMPKLEEGRWMAEAKIIHPNPKQPRSYFDPKEMDELEASILKNGLDTPILVAPIQNNETGEAEFIIVEGERRYRVLTKLGQTEMPVTVTSLPSETKLYEKSLMLNETRAGHNPIERANAYKTLMERYIEESPTAITETKAIEMVSGVVGKGVNTIRNYLRLLELNPRIQEMVIKGTLPTSGALNIIKEQKKFGPDLDQARLAALLLAKPDEDYTKRKKGVGILTRRDIQAALHQALVSGGGLSEEEELELGVANDVLKMIGGLRKMNKIGKGLLKPDKKEAALVNMSRRSGNSVPTEVVIAELKETMETFRMLYKEILKPAVSPPLTIPEGAPSFQDYILRHADGFGTKTLRLEIAKVLAMTSDEEGNLLTAEQIAEIISREQAGTVNSKIVARIIRNVPDNLPPGLRIDSGTLRIPRGKRKFMEKTTGYRLAWTEKMIQTGYIEKGKVKKTKKA